MKKVIMKKGVCGSILMVLILSFLSSACSKHADNGSGKNAATLLIDARTTQYFTQERVPEADMEHIRDQLVLAHTDAQREETKKRKEVKRDEYGR